jgi:hypothetical protein
MISQHDNKRIYYIDSGRPGRVQQSKAITKLSKEEEASFVKKKTSYHAASPT